ncbi:MAG TPA: amino acid racemase [Chitinophagaceae bacterium]|nr:amino acid racemase [Chitinophagaceae bacterium]
MKTKTIGIVGGMGPEAGMLLFNSILTHTKAATDQGHLPVLLMSCPAEITDRTSFLEGLVSVNPAFSVAKIIRKLELAGAEIIGLACNTIHAPEIFDVLKAELRRVGCLAQLLNMPVETCCYLRGNYPAIHKVGLMATVGTYKTGLYKNTLQQMGYEVIMPPPDFQRSVIHRMIYDPEFGLKANANNITAQAVARMDAAIKFFEEEKAEAIILGCTELPLVIAGAKCNYNVPLISSTDALALALIREASQVTTPTNEQAATYSF